MDVGAQVERGAGDLVQVGHGLRHGPAAGLALADEQVQQQQVGVDAVALGQVHAEAVAAGLLAAHHGAGLDHLGAHVLEADRRLVDVHTVALAEADDHRGLVDGGDHRRALAAVLEQVVHQQAVALELVDEDAVLVDRAGAVGIAVEQQAQVVAARRGRVERLVHVWADGLGLTPPNQGLRSLWISSTTMRPPASRRLIQPAPEPYSGSTSTRMSAALSRSRSSERRTKRT